MEERLDEVDLAVLRGVALHDDEVVTAGEIHETIQNENSIGVDVTKRTINNRLHELVQSGLVGRKRAGSRAVVYWLTDDGSEELIRA
jgi:repressor of nif and glnA expression